MFLNWATDQHTEVLTSIVLFPVLQSTGDRISRNMRILHIFGCPDWTCRQSKNERKTRAERGRKKEKEGGRRKRVRETHIHTQRQLSLSRWDFEAGDLNLWAELHVALLVLVCVYVCVWQLWSAVLYSQRDSSINESSVMILISLNSSSCVCWVRFKLYWLDCIQFCQSIKVLRLEK